MVEGILYQPSEIASFLEEVESYLDPSSLEVAWEILIEEEVPLLRNRWRNYYFPLKVQHSVMRLIVYLARTKIYF